MKGFRFFKMLKCSRSKDTEESNDSSDLFFLICYYNMCIYIIILVQFAWVFLNYVDFKFQHASRKSMQWAPLSMSSCPFGLSKSTWHLREWQTKSHNHCWATTCTNLSLIKKKYIYLIYTIIHMLLPKPPSMFDESNSNLGSSQELADSVQIPLECVLTNAT